MRVQHVTYLVVWQHLSVRRRVSENVAVVIAGGRSLCDAAVETETQDAVTLQRAAEETTIVANLSISEHAYTHMTYLLTLSE